MNSKPDPEVQIRSPKVRQFNAEYKRRIFKEANACSLPGEVAALLRREGLYSSYLTEWRRAVQEAEAQAFAEQKRGPHRKDPKDVEIERLKSEVEKLKVRLNQTEVIIDIQKKVSALLGNALPGTGERS